MICLGLPSLKLTANWQRPQKFTYSHPDFLILVTLNAFSMSGTPLAGGDPDPQRPKTAEVLASGSVQNGACGTVSANDGRPRGVFFGGWTLTSYIMVFLGWFFSIKEYEYI